MAEFLSRETVDEATSTGDVEREEALLKDIKGIVESLRGLYDTAYDAYLPLVDDRRKPRPVPHRAKRLFVHSHSAQRLRHLRVFRYGQDEQQEVPSNQAGRRSVLRRDRTTGEEEARSEDDVEKARCLMLAETAPLGLRPKRPWRQEELYLRGCGLMPSRDETSANRHHENQTGFGGAA